MTKRTGATYTIMPMSGFKDGGGVSVSGYVEFTDNYTVVRKRGVAGIAGLPSNFHDDTENEIRLIIYTYEF